MLEIRKVCKSFGGLVAIRNLDMSVSEGEIVGLIGPNGSGKTTLFNLISGLLRPDRGEIRFNGEDIAGLKSHAACQCGIARTFQLTKTFAHMTTLKNVMVGRVYGSKPSSDMKEASEDCERILEFVGLADKRLSMAGMLGLVDRKRLEIARALATRPKLLLLDEMMAGLTPTEMNDAIQLVREINASGITLIVVEHAIKAILKISTKIIALSAGQKIAEGLPQDVVRNEQVIKAYLGEKKQHVWE
jgi:branched-chain amino acid transport system ATP-binding protein